LLFLLLIAHKKATGQAGFAMKLLHTCRISITACVVLSAVLVEGREVRTLQNDWSKGDVVVGVTNGSYNVFNNTGVFKETIYNGFGGGATAGCAFNHDGSKLYTTVYLAGKVFVFDAVHPHNVLQIIDTGPGYGTASVVFDAAGNFYVGHNVDPKIHKYNATGTLLGTYTAAAEHRGTEFIDLAKDQCTMYFPSSRRRVKRFNVCSNTQLPDFATVSGSGYVRALRILPPGDGSGGLLVADYFNIKRLNGVGKVVQIYDIDSQDNWFSLSLDPDGTSFWSGDVYSRRFYRFDISSGRKIVGPIVSLRPKVGGLCVFGEVTAASPCGDGNLQIGEECDDGNTVNGDGCSSTCQLEINNCTITFNLYNSRTDSLVAALTSGTTIANPPPCRQMNFAAVLFSCGNVGNVTLELYRASQLVRRKTEQVSPYFLFGNHGGNVSDGTIIPSKYGIRAQVGGGFWSPFTNFTMGGQCD
jgi:cysteine-rich repeat protein